MTPTRRETKLLDLVSLLWAEVRRSSDNAGAIDWTIRQQGMAWAIGGFHHIDDESWLTPDEIEHELGYAAATVRVWAHRYGLIQVRGRYRWGDIRRLEYGQDSRAERAKQVNDNRVIS